jgi:hypothetical protein
MQNLQLKYPGIVISIELPCHRNNGERIQASLAQLKNYFVDGIIVTTDLVLGNCASLNYS